MCGIAGFFSVNEFSDVQLNEVGERMGRQLQHRGPDDSGLWCDSTLGLVLAHRRLSILDLSIAGHQPMHSLDERYVMVFNGEIYNHSLLRTELQTAGLAPAWRGHSDTETLLACFMAWGIVATLQRTVGMFALALWDHLDGSLTLARDRLGEKPLYYGWVRDTFVFGSELKALRAYPGFDNPVSRHALSLYLQHSMVPAPHSIYQHIFKLEPGCIASVRRATLASKFVKVAPYWKFLSVAHRGITSPIHDENQAVNLLDSALRQAVALQSISDVSSGAFLSGGLDSSTIVALMQSQSSKPVQTFTVGFDIPEFDESRYALAVSRHLGTEHHAIHITSADTQKVIPLLPAIYDEPFADSSQIPTYLVCQAARRHVTMVLSGDGGDELFGGYNRYVWGPRLWSQVGWMPFPTRQWLGKCIEHIPATFWDALGRTLPRVHSAAHFADKARKVARLLRTVRSHDDLYNSLITEWPNSIDLVKGLDYDSNVGFKNSALLLPGEDATNHMMLWDTLSYLPDDILTKVDRAAMSVGLETRTPYLDHRVVELAWQLPLHMKIRNGQTKWVLRQVLYKYVPRELIERPKAGFSIPIGQWLRGPLREWAENLLDENRIRSEGYLNPAPIRTKWLEHMSGRFDHATSLWTILMFQAWLEREWKN